MPSVVPGYEYDIFVSYRHKDNKVLSGSPQNSHDHRLRGGWVTEFIRDLSLELERTFKEDVSIYFDTNPKDGLLETHDVDKSLGNKLKCLVFIPILSQVYCDTRSFAWQYEFCAFNKMALGEPIGRDIKLRSGNVASRILPVTIHNLDPEDRSLIETELQSKLRAIDFIFRSPGVNRPLLPDDKKEDNANKLAYRDQINKMANAIKEIITAIKYPDRVVESYPDNLEDAGDASYVVEAKIKKEPHVSEKSLAVLPFASISQDSSQEYFAEGITENILIQLASIPQLRVISRTSVMRYKKTDKTAPEIANELGVKYLLEGSVQAHGNKVRITVQLIDAIKDQHLWSKVFVENMDDIFAIQSHVAEVVAKELISSLQPKETEKLREVPTKNLEAYDLFLKGRHAFNQWSVEGYRTATEYFKRAIEKDPDFKQAYSYLASSYSARMSWNGDLSPAEAQLRINQYLPEAWKRGATDNDYLTKAFVEFFINKDFSATEQLLKQAMQMSPNNAPVIYTYSYLLSMMGRLDESMAAVERASKIEPLSVAYFNFKGIVYYLQQKYTEATATFQEGLKLYPMVLRFYDHLARVQVTTGLYEEAIHTAQSGLKMAVIRPPSLLAYLAIAYLHQQEKEKANALLKELIERSERYEKGTNLYITHIFLALDDESKAAEWFKKAQITNDIDLIWLQVDPLLSKLRLHSETIQSQGSPDYEAAEKLILSRLEKELPPSLHYHNMSHIKDVMESAERIAEAEGISSEEKRLLRVAALFHDAGFIFSPKNHEERGCDLAKSMLPPFGFTTQQIEMICGMIMATRIPQTPHTHLEKIVCDADLDYLGRDDFFETGKSLYMEMKERGFIETEREWNLIQKTFLETHRYHTRFSKENREQKKQQHLQAIIASFQR
jgi:TolB-like protein/Tfp pilus assembly protein PilF/predicted metal-dependent HD superfamily phosphohydrolase